MRICKEWRPELSPQTWKTEPARRSGNGTRQMPWVLETRSSRVQWKFSGRQQTGADMVAAVFLLW